MPAERFTAMGASCHVVVDGPDALLTLARHRIDDLESRWSRFRPDSEITRLNHAGGQMTLCSTATFTLIQRALEYHRLTGGMFDPSVLGDVIRAGYDRNFADLPGDRAGAPVSRWRSGIGHTVLLPELQGVILPEGVGFDPGGIGKGLAADLVSRTLLEAGARGVCVNIGGDLRVRGQWEGRAGWPLAIDDPWSGAPLERLALADGGLATSATHRRNWLVDGERRHHLIDPRNGRPSDSDLVSVSVVAADATRAEVLAKVGLLVGSARCLQTVGAGGGRCVAVAQDGRILTSFELDEEVA